MVLAGIALKIFIEFERATIEALSVMAAGNRLLAPSAHVQTCQTQRRAAASKAAEAFGGFSKSARTRLVSRFERTIRSARSTTWRAAGNTLRMMKLVTSNRSYAAAIARRRFSSLVARSSIRSLRLVAVVRMMAFQRHANIMHGRHPYKSRHH